MKNKNFILSKVILKFIFSFLFFVIISAVSFCQEIVTTDSALVLKEDSSAVLDFKTYRIFTNLNEEQDIIKSKLYNLQYELGILRGMELEELEIYVDKTSDDKSKWNIIINDTTLSFIPQLKWSYLSDESKDLLDNWSGQNTPVTIKPDEGGTIIPNKNAMFRVMAVPLINMNEDTKLSNLQKDYTYEIVIVDDYPEQIEIQQTRGIIVKRIDNNRFRLKLSRFNRAEFEKWSENRDNDPYVYTTSIILYDKISNQKSKPINLRYTFGEY